MLLDSQRQEKRGQLSPFPHNSEWVVLAISGIYWIVYSYTRIAPSAVLEKLAGRLPGEAALQ